MEIDKIYLGDASDLIRNLPDKSIDLCLTDPPYAINADKGTNGFGSSSVRHYVGGWDSKPPSKELFDEILRVSKKAIIFGGNYFTDRLPLSHHWIVWDKTGNTKFKNPFSDCELAWTSLENLHIVKKYICLQQGFITDSRDERVHPTQKPTELIEQIIADYSKEGEVIFDPFSGSGTTAVCAKKLNRKFIAFEIDEGFYNISIDRLNGISQEDRKRREEGQISLF